MDAGHQTGRVPPLLVEHYAPYNRSTQDRVIHTDVTCCEPPALTGRPAPAARWRRRRHRETLVLEPARDKPGTRPAPETKSEPAREALTRPTPTRDGAGVTGPSHTATAEATSDAKCCLSAAGV